MGISGKVGVWTKAPDAKIPPNRGRGGTPTRYVYGDQRPTAVAEVALQAKGWKEVRWREGAKGWLESRFGAMRIRPSHGFVHISVNLIEAVSMSCAGRLGQGPADRFPLTQHGGQTLGQQEGRGHLAVQEFRLAPAAAPGLPRHNPRGKLIRRPEPGARSASR